MLCLTFSSFTTRVSRFSFLSVEEKEADFVDFAAVRDSTLALLFVNEDNWPPRSPLYMTLVCLLFARARRQTPRCKRSRLRTSDAKTGLGAQRRVCTAWRLIPRSGRTGGERAFAGGASD